MEKDKEFTVARLILRMANQIVKNRNLHVKALGLTTEQADSLLFFLSHENAVINDLKDYLRVTHQTARGIVQRMEGKGVVTTRKSPTDGRYQVVSLSEKGCCPRKSCDPPKKGRQSGPVDRVPKTSLPKNGKLWLF